MTGNRKYFTGGHTVDGDFNSVADALYELGFDNSSWHNEASPSFSRGETVVFVDRVHLGDREPGIFKRFGVVEFRAGVSLSLFESDSIDELLSFLKQMRGKKYDE